MDAFVEKLLQSVRSLQQSRSCSTLLKEGKVFITHVVPAVVKPIRVLWNEVIGFIFLSFAVLVAFSTWRNYKEGGQAAGNPLVLLAGGAFALMLLWYGVSSFRRARKISRT
ncbi:MAG: hypothetical protein H7039_04205 [Bryobacteraceae bacterium]|nr:hypothetical protein [Bryobacteraceae bacterium]